jgi:hypothetical protein
LGTARISGSLLQSLETQAGGSFAITRWEPTLMGLRSTSEV